MRGVVTIGYGASAKMCCEVHPVECRLTTATEHQSNSEGHITIVSFDRAWETHENFADIALCRPSYLTGVPRTLV